MNLVKDDFFFYITRLWKAANDDVSGTKLEIHDFLEHSRSQDCSWENTSFVPVLKKWKQVTLKSGYVLCVKTRHYLSFLITDISAYINSLSVYLYTSISPRCLTLKKYFFDIMYLDVSVCLFNYPYTTPGCKFHQFFTRSHFPDPATDTDQGQTRTDPKTHR